MQCVRILSVFMALTMSAAAAAPLAAQSPSVGPSAVPTPPVTTGQLMPAGTQFGPVEELPRSLEVTDLASTIAERDGVMVVMGVRRARQYAPARVVAGVRATDGSWQVVEVDRGKGLRGPGGSVLYSGVYPSGLAAGPEGFVAVGSAGLYPGTNVPGQIVGLIWYSANGRDWRRIDARSVVGSRTTFQLEAVMALPGGGFMAAGSLGAFGFKKPSTIAVLTSADGRTWRKSAVIKGRWAVDVTRLQPFGDRVLMSGIEITCASDSENQRIFTIGDQGRYWVSDARGRTWEPIDTAATGVISSARPMPTRAKDCPRRDSTAAYQRYQDWYSTSGGIVGGANGLVVAMDGTGSRLSTSSDLRTWQLADLPGAAPAGDPPPDRGLLAAQIVDDPAGDGIALVTVEHRRTSEDEVDDGATSFLGWSTADGGTSWQRLPATTPVAAELRVTSRLFPDGSVLLLSTDDDSHGSIRRSVAGPLSVPVCEPGPAAECAFQTLSSVDLAGRDLSGIQLAGTKLDQVTLDGANLRGADLRGADVVGSLRGADLRDTLLAGADIHADLAGAQLAGAEFTGTSITGTSSRPLDLRGVDFRKAATDRAYIYYADLTGARFTRQQRATVGFWFGVTCPDGKPMDETSGATDPCRLGPR